MLRPDWDPAKAAVVICDMWDAHHCVSAARRVVEMAPRVNEVVTRLRQQGALIIHAPGGCMDFYRSTPARLRAMQAPHAATTVPIQWNGWDRDQDAALPATLTAPGRCSCDPADAGCAGEPPIPGLDRSH